MPRIDFYLLENSQADAVELTTCKLCEKAYQQQQSVYIYTQNAQEAQKIDAALWTYNKTSFLPHEIITRSDCPVKTPLLIGFIGSPLPSNYDILINLTPQIPDFFNDVSRIIEIVSNREPDRQAARDRFRFYRQNVCKPNSHVLHS